MKHRDVLAEQQQQLLAEFGVSATCLEVEIARLEAEKRQQIEERRAKQAAELQVELTKLPIAGMTTDCPKCRFNYLTYRYQECEWRKNGGWGSRITTNEVNGVERKLYSTAMLLVRSCPQCGADTFERPADSEAGTA